MHLLLAKAGISIYLCSVQGQIKQKRMSNTKHTAEERKDFRKRLSDIELLIPGAYSEVIHGRTGISKDIIRNVRHGRTINMEVLEALETLCNETVTKEA